MGTWRRNLYPSNRRSFRQPQAICSARVLLLRRSRASGIKSCGVFLLLDFGILALTRAGKAGAALSRRERAWQNYKSWTDGYPGTDFAFITARRMASETISAARAPIAVRLALAVAVPV